MISTRPYLAGEIEVLIPLLTPAHDAMIPIPTFQGKDATADPGNREDNSLFWTARLLSHIAENVILKVETGF